MITPTPFSQAVRDRFNQWSGGRGRLGPRDLDRLSSDGTIQGEDRALLSVLRQLPGQVGHRAVTGEALAAYEGQFCAGQDTLESHYADCLERLNTPSVLFPQGVPDATCVRQGSKPDCVLTSTCIALAQQRPECLTAMLSDSANGVILKLPGDKGRCVSMPTDQELISNSCAYTNGAWMTVIAKEVGAVGGVVPAKAIKKITGHRSDQDLLFMTPLSTTKEKLELAMEKRAVVIAGRGGYDKEVPGLTRNHSYAVVGYDPAFSRVRLQDPEGNEPVDAQGKPLDGEADGRFSLPVADFRAYFSTVHYERTESTNIVGSWFGKLKDALAVPSASSGGVPVSH